MKIIYKVSTATLRSDEDFTAWRFFDSYDEVGDWLEKYYGQDRKLTKLKIDTLILCNDCGEYSNPTSYSFLKNVHGDIMTYCVSCAPKNTIDKKPFMRENSNERNN